MRWETAWPGMPGGAALDRRTQIQALDRTQSGLPLKPGRCGTTTDHYKRNGTTTLSAALDGRSPAAACSATGIRDSSISSTIEGEIPGRQDHP